MLKPTDTIAVIDFGGQYAHLIANRIRRLGVYSEIAQPDAAPASLKKHKGIILSGGPASVLETGCPMIAAGVLTLGIPLLGLCYGHQLIALKLGGSVVKGRTREYGRASLRVIDDSDILRGLKRVEQVWMSHGDTVRTLPRHFRVLGSTDDCAAAAVGDPKRSIFGLQFHPEVTDTPNGMKILDNFLAICGCKREWNARNHAEAVIKDARDNCGGRKVFLLVSGGVDSSVAFALLTKALGPDRVTGLHIDNGLMRYRESEEILDYLSENGFDNLLIENASDEFLNALAGVADPEEKRVRIGNTFISVKDRVFQRLGLNPDEWVLAQGTIYPDTIESGGTRHAARIKTHHNRVDIILDLIAKGQVIEPLSQFYKDEVREIGRSLGLPDKLLRRHPFPGPGLGVRVLCSDGSTAPIAHADARRCREITDESGYRSVILPLRSVGVQGDGRTYAHPALVTGDLDWGRLDRLSTRITNTLKAINRVVYGLKVGDVPHYTLVRAFVSRERLDKLRAFDRIVTEALYASKDYDNVWQMPVILLPLVNGRGEESVVLRPVVSQEAMTAGFAPIHKRTLDMIVANSLNVKGIGDIFFDITHKPPGTIEWE
ncbi:MAG: glutamine-hydrolyzing GMP synthase [Chitinispirillaceae bacterium]|nr:glutamine-hydrolyzing GMP synthase [Chitinispirillaceae bacterium]